MTTRATPNSWPCNGAASGVTEAELLAQVGWVRALARSLASPRVDAEDLQQDALVAALERSPAGAAPLRPWLARVVHNLARKQGRTAQRRQERERVAAAEERSGGERAPEEVLEHVALLQQVVGAVLALDAPERDLVLAHYFEGLTPASIARRTGVAPATVRKRLERARERLRKRLLAWHGGSEPGLARALLAFASGSRATPAAPPLAAVSTQATGGFGAQVLGGLLMKKVLWLGAGLVALIGLWRARGLVGFDSAGARGPSSTTELAMEGASESAFNSPELVDGLSDTVDAERERTAPEVAQRGAPGAVDAVNPPGTLDVRVTRADGRTPVAGEVVTVRLSRLVLEEPGEGVPETRVDDFALATDAEGRARFTLASGELRVTTLRYGDEYRWLQLAPGAALEARFALPRGVDLEVSVVDEQGSPLPGAEIWSSEPWDRLRGHRIGRTDAAGRFELVDAQPFGENWIGARAPGRSPSPWRYFEGAAGSRVALRIALDREGIALAGRVLDERGAPIAGARVILGFESADWSAAEGGSPPLLTNSAADGSFRFPAAPLGRQPLVARALGHGVFSCEIDLLARPEQSATIVLPTEARVRGTVRDANGGAVAGALVYSGARDGIAGTSTRTDEGGNFRLRGLAPGTVELSAHHDELGRAHTSLYATAGVPARWEAVLVPVPRIFGTLRDTRGRALAGVRLRAWVPVDGEPVEHTTRSDESGRFTFGELPDRRHTLLVEPDPERAFPLLRRDVRPSLEGLELELVDLESEAGALLARVVGPEGQPIAGAVLRARALEREVDTLEAASDDAGALRLRCASGRLDLELAAEGYPTLELGEHALSAGEQRDLGTLVLRAPARVRVHLSGIDEATARALVALWSRDGEELEPVTPDGLELESPGLDAGSVALTLQGPGVERRELELVLEEGATLDADVELAPAAGIEVVVALPEAGRPAHAYCELWDEVGDRMLWAEDRAPAPAGPLVWNVWAPAGTWSFTTGTSDGRSTSAAITFPAAGLSSAPVQLTLE